MKTITEFNKLAPIINNPVFFADDAKKLGVHPSVLNYYVNKGLIISIGHGVYRNKNATIDSDFKFEDHDTEFN